MKHKKGKKEESVYDNIIRDANSANRKAIKELTGYLTVENSNRKKNIPLNLRSGFGMKDENYFVSSNLIEQELEEKLAESTVNNKLYMPKRKVKFTPSNLMSYMDPSGFGRKFAKEKETDDKKTLPFQIISPHYPNYNNTDKNREILNKEKEEKEKPHIFSQPHIQHTNAESDYLTFKTHFILKFAKNLENYEKLHKYFDIISDSSKKTLLENYHKLKSTTEKKDRVLFDAMNNANNTNNTNNTNSNSNSIQNWKDSTVLFYDFEVYWLKIAEIAFRELKSLKDTNIQLSKKVNDQDNLIKLKDGELKYLNTFIESNDIQYKSLIKKRKMKDVNEIKDEYEKKEKLNLINMFRLEEEIKDLTGLLDKDKEYYDKYNECLEQIELKKKEIEDLRIRFNAEGEEKKLRIAYLNNEKHELNRKIIVLEKELAEFRDIFENSKKEYIEFHTQLKILKQSINERNENISMLTEEVEIWMNELYKERLSHFNTQQTVTALEIKLHSIRKDKIHNTTH